ncbi:MAG: AmmeMemoRadiSam system protein B [Solirubrobacterales bacterium]
MQSRKPVVAGQFYPSDPAECLAQVRECLESGTSSESLPEPLVAGIVPHAGWTFSGPLAGMVFAAVKKQRSATNTFVICGAAHGYFGAKPALDSSDVWETPLGTVPIDGALRQTLLDAGAAVASSSAHRREHSIEVQVPFVRHLFPEARILPIIVPANESALALGNALADLPAETIAGMVCIGSTDLTHYGPRYGFTPMGVGAEGLGWASSVNDRQFIDLATALEPERLLADAIENGNACGPGAAAAVVTVAKRRGVAKGVLLAHTTSNEIMLRQMGSASRDSVGYAAIVF